LLLLSETRFLKNTSKIGLMKPFLLSVALLFTIVANSQLVRKSHTFGGNTVWFYEYRTPGLPASYKYPVIISLGGVGQQGDGSAQSMDEHLAADGLPQLIKQGATLKLTVGGQPQGFLVVAPQMAFQSGPWPEFYTDVMVNFVKTTYSASNPNVQIDPNRIFLVGFSLGGGGAWRYVTSTPARAADIAGIVPVSGSGDAYTSNYCYIAQNKVAVWAFHTQLDGLIPASTTIGAVNTINACPGILIPARATIFPDGSHSSWNERVFSDSVAKWHIPNIYDWMIKVSKTLNPATNLPPVASAVIRRGADVGQNLTLNVPVRSDQIVLDGSASSDPDDIVAEYSWTKVNSPVPTFFNDFKYGGTSATSDRPTATIVREANGNRGWMEPGTYNYKFDIIDYKSTLRTVNLTLTVQLPATGNALPGAYIDPNVTVGPTETSTFYFADDKDWDHPGDIGQRIWSQLSGPPGSAPLAFGNQGGTSSSVNNIITPGTYVIEYKVIDDNGGVGTATSTITKLAAPLPVIFNYLKGKNLNNHNIISWSTTSEISNDRFEIMRSTDGTNFTLIGTVAAKGNASGSEYSFDDANAVKGTSYYRLNQIDKDGKTSLSKVIRIDNNGRAVAIEKYPNPVNSILTVSIEGNTGNNIGISIADMQGRIVKQQQWKKDNLLLKKDISVANLQSGIYQLILTFTDGRREVTGFIKY
jgi:dienelactone hydrolase